MSYSISRSDLSAMVGVALFAFAGLSAGAALRPSAREMIGPQGPQTLQPVSGERVEAIGGGTAFADYKYGIPDYVIGTDWLRPEVPIAAAETEDRGYEPEPYVPERFVTVEAPAPEVPREPPTPRYPSVGGDIYASAPDAPEPPQPPQAPTPPEAPPA